MGSDDDENSVVAITRLKREDYNRTKHDSHFSKWQVLIGPSDWEDYAMGKEGALRYRVHNLPTSSSSGLYELGIAVSRSGLGRDVGKLDPDDIVVVYLGQADNVRTRLQSYGRSGAHLGNSYSNGHWNDDSKVDSPQNGAGLFEDIFSKGYSIVFRWASMKDKRGAETTEAQLLDTFDYAWNKGRNGVRRPNDIYEKLDKIASSTSRFPNISKRVQMFSQGKVGIKIEASKPDVPEKCTSPDHEDSKNFLPGIFKFNRSQPRLVADRSGIDEEVIHICGFIMEEGIPCKRPPVPGRKRCEEHKGKRIYGLRLKSNYVHDTHLNSHSHIDQEKTICGVNLVDGTFCRSQPMPGRTRCEEHKGMRFNSSISKQTADNKFHAGPSFSSVFGTSSDWMNSNASSKIKVDDVLQFQSSSSVNEHVSAICGAALMNGSFCRRRPAQGNKWCWQHKDTRTDSISKQRADNKFHVGPSFSSVFGTSSDWMNSNTSSKIKVDDVLQFQSSSSVNEHVSAICGATLMNGSFCRRQPAQGNKRCWQHKGMRTDSALSGSSFSFPRFDAPNCGVTLKNGSVCTRAPVHGRKRCEQHKGMRA